MRCHFGVLLRSMPLHRPAAARSDPRLSGDLSEAISALHDSRHDDIYRRLDRLVQVAGDESSYLSHKGMIVNISFVHREDDRYAPCIGPRHFHDRPYGDFAGVQEIHEKRVTA